MRVVQNGDRVTIHYIGTLDNGGLFDTADEENPLRITLGQGEVFPALEAAVLGMKVGAANNLLIPAAQAYGPHRKENMLRVSRQQFASERELRVNEKLSLAFADGEEQIMRVVTCDSETVTLDGNHPLAGLDLTFAFKLVSIDPEGAADA